MAGLGLWSRPISLQNLGSQHRAFLPAWWPSFTTRSWDFPKCLFYRTRHMLAFFVLLCPVSLVLVSRWTMGCVCAGDSWSDESLYIVPGFLASFFFTSTCLGHNKYLNEWKDELSGSMEAPCFTAMLFKWSTYYNSAVILTSILHCRQDLQ